jgi:uncharacterized 2Fe-2S/4Fe-4S cluster protein (DUF4445 family)
MRKFHLVLEPSGLRVLVDDNTLYLDAIRESGLHIPSECGGKGTCGKCKVRIQPEPSSTSIESRILTANEIDGSIRLACQHTVDSDSRVLLPELISDVKILMEGISTAPFDIKPKLEGQVGAAIDIGTTTLVAYLMDLGTGEQVGSSSMVNPQIEYGEDIVTRLNAAVNSPKAHHSLQMLVVHAVEELCRGLCEDAEIDASVLSRLAVVGNTVMHHLFLGLDVSSLSVAPYIPTRTSAQTNPADEVGFTRLSAEIYTAPLIAGFVGSDITALILSQNLYESDDVVLAIDIGTNGEIVLAQHGALHACSTAAGSAFEGATITSGMRGQTGAIEHFSIPDLDSMPDITVIGQTKPRGICGSGIVDIVAFLLQAGILTPNGRLHESKRIIEDSLGRAYVVVGQGELGAEERILFTQKDVRQVQVAKAAIQAGTQVLMKHAGIQIKDLDRVIVAGAFGNYISPESAMDIGLLPRISRTRVLQAGNTAGVGAKMMLMSSKMRSLAEQIAMSVEHIQLSGSSDFQQMFLDSTALGNET